MRSFRNKGKQEMNKNIFFIFSLFCVSGFYSFGKINKKKARFYPRETILASSIIANEKRLEALAHSIANANTDGFRSIYFDLHPYLTPPAKQRFVHAKLGNLWVNNSSGNYKKTNDPFHLAIIGQGFFLLEDGRITRNGNFLLKKDGSIENVLLKTKLMSQGGDILILPDKTEQSQIFINQEGVVFVRGERLSKIAIVRPENINSLKPNWDSSFTADALIVDSESKVMQGMLESSNVNSKILGQEYKGVINSENLYKKLIESTTLSEQQAMEAIFGN